MPTHGELVPGMGYYDASLRGYVDRPTKVTPVSTAGRLRSRPDFGEARTDFRTVEERRDAPAAANWRPDPELEALRRLRDDALPERRAQAQRMLSGTRTTAMAYYEAGLQAFLAQGGDLPEGVAKP